MNKKNIVIIPVLIVFFVSFTRLFNFAGNSAEKTSKSTLVTPPVIQRELNKNWLYEGPVYETHPYYYDGTFKGMMGLLRNSLIS